MIQTKLMYDPSVLEEDFRKDLEYFHEYMVKRGAAANTISSYMTSARHFHRLWGQMTMDHLLVYKEWLLANYRPSTVNSRIYGINQYAAALADRDSAAPRPPLHLSSIRQQQKPFLDNVISRRDYERLKRRLKKDGNLFWYFTVRMLGATGARVSELIQIKAEHIRIGYMDLCSKGGKVRRIYFPERLCMELSAWLLQRGVETGFIFTNRQGQPMTPRGISIHLKKLAVQYHIPPSTVYPHSFRHRFAKNFLSKCNDISLLADLMGHDSIETTRIYLTRSSAEQRELIDRIVIW